MCVSSRLRGTCNQAKSHRPVFGAHSFELQMCHETLTAGLYVLHKTYCSISKESVEFAIKQCYSKNSSTNIVPLISKHSPTNKQQS